MMNFQTNDYWDDIDLFSKAGAQLWDDWHFPINVRDRFAKYPAINIETSNTHYDYYVFIAGVGEDQLDISLEQNALIISGEKNNLIPQRDDVLVRLNECKSGKFSRTLNLPSDADKQSIKAHYTCGVLHIGVRRQASKKSTAIQINCHPKQLPSKATRGTI